MQMHESVRSEPTNYWESLRATAPHLRARDAAAYLGITEAELVGAMPGWTEPADPERGTTVVRLDADAANLLHALAVVGPCTALTRNEHAISVVRGRYGGVELGAHAGQVTGEHIALRVFARHWRQAFAMDEPVPREPGARRRSIHVFDAAGAAVHEVYLEADGDARTWDAIVASRATTRTLVVEPAPVARRERPDATVDVAALRAGWDAMLDSDDLCHLLASHRVSRTQALRLAGPERARPVHRESLTTVLFEAARSGEQLAIFVGNPGCVQVYSGPVQAVSCKRPWIEVVDPRFNLHVREDRIASSWVVAKPTRSGVVRSLELFDAGGEPIALVFRKRDDREYLEHPAWGALLDRLPEAT